MATSAAVFLGFTTTFVVNVWSAQSRAEQVVDHQSSAAVDTDGLTAPSAAREQDPRSVRPAAGPGRLAATPTLGEATTINTYGALIAKEAGQQGLAPEIVEAVMSVESGYNPEAIGGSGEIGLMQILPSTARMLGFIGTNADLAVPETNIHYGVRYLAQAWRLAGGDLCTATMKYRAGHGETRFSYLSIKYCLAVRGKLVARGFAVTGEVPTPTFGTPGSAGPVPVGSTVGCGRRCLVAPTTAGRIDLASLNARLSTLVVQARAGR